MGDEVVDGKVKWFNNDRGYGFIYVLNEEGEVNTDNEYFVHYSNINIDGYRTLQKEQLVKCVLKPTDKGVQAFDVVPVT